jgi:transcription elongation factor Elf1
MRTTTNVLRMKTQIPYPEIRGTRAGYVIRFTCPSCATEGIIVSRIARDHFRNSRVATCRHCRTHLTVLTPDKDR